MWRKLHQNNHSPNIADKFAAPVLAQRESIKSGKMSARISQKERKPLKNTSPKISKYETAPTGSPNQIK